MANNKSPIKQIDYNYGELTLKYLYKKNYLLPQQTNEIETTYILEGSCNKLGKIKIGVKNNKSFFFSLCTNSIGNSNKWVI